MHWRPHQRRRRRDNADQDPALPRSRAIVRHRTPRPREEEQVQAFSRRGRRRPQALRTIRIYWKLPDDLELRREPFWSMYLRTLCHFPILRFRALECHLYLCHHPIKGEGTASL